MKRPVALFTQMIGAAAMVTMFVSACAPASTVSPQAVATNTVKQAIDQVPAANDVAPVVNNHCDQNTHPAYTPDNSGFALLPGGGESMKVIYTKAVALAKEGMNGGFLLNFLPAVDITSAASIASLKEGVMCPDGHIYAYGNPHALMEKARIINEDSNGPTARPSGSGTFSHDAAEILPAPCPAIIRIIGILPHTETLFFQAVCKNNGALLDTNSITINTVFK